jgi:uncharacterized protein (TIGR02246 family)
MAVGAGSREDVSAAIIALEQTALDRWCTGDPTGFLEISAPDVVYFDPFLARRVDGLKALTAYYDSLRGTISASRWEIVDPRVQVEGDVAVLTFNFVSWGDSGDAMHWHCTEVYERLDGAWRIIQTHWSVAPKG